MPKAKNTQGIIVGHYIYLLGGEQNQPLSEIERYNIENGQWEHIGEFPTNITYSGITTDGEKIYLYSNGHIYIYYPDNNILKKYNTDCLYADCCNMCYFNHKLYIFGGKTEEDFNYEPIRDVYSIDMDEFKHTNYITY